MKNYYELLSIPSEACSGEINNAYYNNVQIFLSSDFHGEFLQLSEGYEILINEKTRAEYNSLISNLAEFNDNLITAIDLINNNKLSSAIKLLEDITSKECTLLIPKILLGKAYLYNKNSGKAIKLFEQLTAEEPDNICIAGNLAYAYLQRKFIKKALETYKKYLEQNDSNVYLWLGLSEAYKAMEDNSQAEEALEKVNNLLNAAQSSSVNLINVENLGANKLIQVPLYVMNKSQNALEKHSMLNEPLLYQLDNLQNNELMDDYIYDIYNDEFDYYDEDSSSLQPIVNTEPKIGRNDSCLCGSGKKYKKCCGR